ncbi:hypothetical protein BJF83_21460 [Nocardiopsis sp. CNR-923]|uniref:hypothetical protein n=1 Tax=Nocardiopsis sp. CNR-923 TaxID=1904965 RepID=UPI00095CD277|nr:hypothetical protein [Nocardiopsis sp. CNR-923]OLT26371.1 hypothetical protein BJF83_21460 [Nocardiopsis sp. CNR-923]
MQAPAGPYHHGTNIYDLSHHRHTAEEVRAWEGQAVELTTVSDPDREIPERIFPNVTLHLTTGRSGAVYVNVHQILGSTTKDGFAHMASEFAEWITLADIVRIRAATTYEPARRTYTDQDIAWLHERTVSLVREHEVLGVLQRVVFQNHVLLVPYLGAPKVELHEIVHSYTSPTGAEVSELRLAATLPAAEIAFVMEVTNQ